MEEKQVLSIADLLRTTGANTNEFMNHVADHITGLEAEVARLAARVAELEATQNATN